MLFCLVICLCAFLTHGAPSFNDNCKQITVDSVNESSAEGLRHDFTLKLQDYYKTEDLCSGSYGNVSITIGLCDKVIIIAMDTTGKKNNLTSKKIIVLLVTLSRTYPAVLQVILTVNDSCKSKLLWLPVGCDIYTCSL